MQNIGNVGILLAEDNDRDAEMTIRALRKGNVGGVVHRVRDGEEALDFAFCTGPYAGRDRASMPKLFLLDLKMPKIDGIEVLHRLKSEEATRARPVVIMTSSNEERDVVASYRFGVNSYVVKPIDFSGYTELVAKIGEYWTAANRVPA